MRHQIVLGQRTINDEPTMYWGMLGCTELGELSTTVEWKIKNIYGLGEEDWERKFILSNEPIEEKKLILDGEYDPDSDRVDLTAHFYIYSYSKKMKDYKIEDFDDDGNMRKLYYHLCHDAIDKLFIVPPKHLYLYEV